MLAINLEDPSHSTNAQGLSQARQDAHNQLDYRLFAVEDRAMRL